MFGYDRIMYLTLHDSFMDDHASLSLSSMSLQHRFDYVLYIWRLFLLLNTFCHAWSRLVPLFHELLFILGVELYAESVTLVDAT
jgi:hypothetical protein